MTVIELINNNVWALVVCFAAFFWGIATIVKAFRCKISEDDDDENEEGDSHE